MKQNPFCFRSYCMTLRIFLRCPRGLQWHQGATPWLLWKEKRCVCAFKQFLVFQNELQTKNAKKAPQFLLQANSWQTLEHWKCCFESPRQIPKFSLTQTILARDLSAQVHNLPKPFGDCEKENPIALSKCRQNFFSEKMQQHCGCVDVYMATSDGGEWTKQREIQNSTSHCMFWSLFRRFVWLMCVVCISDEVCNMTTKFTCLHSSSKFNVKDTKFFSFMHWFFVP